MQHSGVVDITGQSICGVQEETREGAHSPEGSGVETSVVG